MHHPIAAERGVYSHIRRAAVATDFNDSMQHQLTDIFRMGLTDVFRSSDADCILDVHRAVYFMACKTIAVPWVDDAASCQLRFAPLLSDFELAWRKDALRQHSAALCALPSVRKFPSWIVEVVQGHRSNVSHPLFSYLKNEATFAELRHFLHQETPFDILFGDILALVLPGVYGLPKRELASNFWDEMGRGNLARMHRNLRLDMMAALDIRADTHLSELESFCVEELALANHYLVTALHRHRLPELIGSLLATETMVPGRLQCQIDGWKRVGLPDEAMTYLIEHTVVDIEHAAGWLEGVVKPILEIQPNLLGDVVLGVLRRLQLAGDVCDAMHRAFRSGAAAQREAALH